MEDSQLCVELMQIKIRIIKKITKLILFVIMTLNLVFGRTAFWLELGTQSRYGALGDLSVKITGSQLPMCQNSNRTQ